MSERYKFVEGHWVKGVKGARAEDARARNVEDAGFLRAMGV